MNQGYLARRHSLSFIKFQRRYVEKNGLTSLRMSCEHDCEKVACHPKCPPKSVHLSPREKSTSVLAVTREQNAMFLVSIKHDVALKKELGPPVDLEALIVFDSVGRVASL